MADMTEAERIAFNEKMRIDSINGYVTVWWRVARNAAGKLMSGGTSGWGWGLDNKDPEKFRCAHFQYLMLPGHSLDHKDAQNEWFSFVKMFSEAQIDAGTFGPGAAITRIRSFMIEHQKRVNEVQYEKDRKLREQSGSEWADDD